MTHYQLNFTSTTYNYMQKIGQIKRRAQKSGGGSFRAQLAPQRVGEDDEEGEEEDAE